MLTRIMSGACSGYVASTTKRERWEEGDKRRGTQAVFQCSIFDIPHLALPVVIFATLPLSVFAWCLCSRFLARYSWFPTAASLATRFLKAKPKTSPAPAQLCFGAEAWKPQIYADSRRSDGPQTLIRVHPRFASFFTPNTPRSSPNSTEHWPEPCLVV